MIFQYLTTDRLRLRPPRRDDVDAFVARRNEPEVAALQSWSLPYSVEQARAIIDAVAQMPGPAEGEWWMLTIELIDTGEIIGDLALYQTWNGRSMEIGYTIGTEWWGRGFATEAVEGVLERLFADRRMTRVHAMLHPDNIASARVLEHTGFSFEGRTVQSYWVGDDNTDDVLYGLTRNDWEIWTDRPATLPTVMELVQIDEHNIDRVAGLRAHWTQRHDRSGIEALFADLAASQLIAIPPPEIWLRGIAADGELVGCVGVTRIGTARVSTRWTVIDRLHQGRGIESRATDLAAELGMPIVR